MPTNDKPIENLTPTRTKVECKDLLAELVRQRGEAKICHDEQDGWFLQFLYHHMPDSWGTLDLDEHCHASKDEAIEGARLAHNDEVEMQLKTRRCQIHSLIPANVKLRRPTMTK